MFNNPISRNFNQAKEKVKGKISEFNSEKVEQPNSYTTIKNTGFKTNTYVNFNKKRVFDKNLRIENLKIKIKSLDLSESIFILNNDISNNSFNNPKELLIYGGTVKNHKELLDSLTFIKNSKGIPISISIKKKD